MKPPALQAETLTGSWLGRSLAFAVLAFVWWRISENTADNDLWGHVLYGQRMLHLGGLETVESLSWTAAGLPWINHEVLAELALGAAHLLGGGTGLWLLMVGLAGLSLGLAWTAGTDRTQRLTALGLLALCTNFIALGCAARPQLFTLLAFVLLLRSLRSFFAGRTASGMVPPLILAIWVNTHGGFLAGWLLMGAALGAEFLGKVWPSLQQRSRMTPVKVGPGSMVWVALAGTLALVVNPRGWHLVQWTIATVQLPRPAITEWQPMGFSASTLPFWFVLGLGLVAWVASSRPRRLWEMSIWLLLAVVAARQQRHAPLFGLATLIFLPVHLQDLLARLAPATTALRTSLTRPVVRRALTGFLLLAGGWCLTASITAPRQHPFRMEVPRDLYPVAAIAFMRETHLTGDTLTFFDWGQQVLWELPDNRVSFDGRLDTVYPPDIMAAHWRLYAGEEPGPGLDLSRAMTALLPTGSGGVTWLRQHGWSIRYLDPLATVLDRSDGTRPSQTGDAFALRGRESFPDSPPVLGHRITALP